jgi:2-succinyl-5-enolpyruvyl-6-hydroxy-3-cyclohexene-1-carboxylate synthase
VYDNGGKKLKEESTPQQKVTNDASDTTKSLKRYKQCQKEWHKKIFNLHKSAPAQRNARTQHKNTKNSVRLRCRECIEHAGQLGAGWRMSIRIIATDNFKREAKRLLKKHALLKHDLLRKT